MRRWVSTVLILTAVAGCAAAEPEGRIPDATLFAAVGELDGVTSSSLVWQDSLGNSRMYTGRVDVESAADPQCVLYQTLGLLSQGRPGADTAYVSVAQGDLVIRPDDLAFAARSGLADLTPLSDTRPSVPDCAGTDLGVAPRAEQTP